MKKELPSRKENRLRHFDYSEQGAYFITICTEARKNVLSEIIESDRSNDVGEGFPLPLLTKCGEITDKFINAITDKYPAVSVDCYVIMPNHIHLLLSVANDGGRGNPSPTVTSVVGWLKYCVTREINLPKNKAERVFQRSFYDHVVRGRDDYEEIFRYVYENPARWKADELYNDK